MEKTYSEMTNGELIHKLVTEKDWDLVMCSEVCERAELEDSFKPLLRRSSSWSEEDKALFDSLMGRALLCLVKQGEDYCPLDDEIPRGWLADLEEVVEE
ncbi:MAG: hypothetical protein IJK52_01860 [Oscillospiraceae bacterium]|nr:hypothetical protein [Oscillospiraceae bacterium]